MTFLDLPFYLFLSLFLLVFYIVQNKHRYLVIAGASFLFYGIGGYKMLFLLLLSIAITYVGGLVLEKKPKRSVMLFFSLADLSILIVFKYTNFFIENVNRVMGRILPNVHPIAELSLVLPIGLSFFIFQSMTYLSDVYRRGMQAEKNPLRYAAFVAFFPTVLSGPIQKSRNVLPQIKNPSPFSYDQAKKGILFLVWGMFEKLIVANNLALIVNRIYNDLESYNGVYYLFAAISFSFYIYADFSSYSDMARGIAKLMGIDVGKNFDNPYLSVSCAEFWNRWHKSLNDWFVENVYIPLGGNRKGLIRKYVNVMVVFFVSGLWHGAHWNFIAWGVINGLFVLVGQIVKPLKTRIYSFLGVDEEVESVRILRQLIVFLLLSTTWIFFRNGTRNSVYIINRILHIQLIQFFDQNLLSLAGTQISTLLTLVGLVFFIVVQLKRKNEAKSYEVFKRQPLLMQCCMVAILFYLCIFGYCSGNVEVNTQFLYFNF